eukprot:c8077_g1_i1.p1 GENE.c8077_g1_i1~~c8077_g1_i1.p1  ORF type:complete len:607 (+),score=147.11 c8077_g1_i1:44-1822(+)
MDKVKSVARAAKKAAGVDVDKQIAQLVDDFKSSLGGEDLMNLCNEFATIFNNFKEKLPKCQHIANNMGLPNTLLVFIETASVPDQENVLHCLKWMCIRNAALSRTIYLNKPLMSKVQSIISAATTSSSRANSERLLLEIAALRLVSSIARELWDEHASIISQFLPTVLSLLESSSKADVSVRAQGVNFVTVLSYNSAIANQLRSAVPLLVVVVKEANTELNYFGAAIAIANLGDGSDAHAHAHTQSDARDVLSDLEWRTIIQHLRQALVRSLEGADYPEGSRRFYTPWMLCLCISNLCARPRLLEFIRKSQFEEPLRKALHQPSGELQNLQHQYSAVALTYIDIGTAPPATITPLVANTVSNNSNNNTDGSNTTATTFSSLSSLSLSTLPSSFDNSTGTATTLFDVEGCLRMKMELRWHNRYAVLNKNLLRYWKNENRAKENAFVDPRGRWVIKTVGWATTDTTSDVVITNAEGRQAILRFSSFTDAQKWFKAISLFATQEDTATAAEKIRSHDQMHNSKNGGNNSQHAHDSSSEDDDNDDDEVIGEGPDAQQRRVLAATKKAAKSSKKKEEKFQYAMDSNWRDTADNNKAL